MKGKKIVMADEVKKVSPQVLAKIRAMQAPLQNYLQGILDGMGLEGTFSIDENTGELKPILKEKDAPKES